MTRPTYRPIHGVLLLDKPLGPSSNRALQRVRHLFQATKAGHTGSLDPLATGMLPVCLGEATKVAGLMLGADKAYEAEAQLGVVTSTGDAEGEVVSRTQVPPFTHAEIESAMAPLRGRIEQIPPIYSAIKQGGEPLYKRARRGETIEVPSRMVQINQFELLEMRGDTLRVHVECGSGTYIRSLLVDLGAALGCGAYVSALRRSWVDPFSEAEMNTLESLQAAYDRGGLPALDALLLPVDAGLQHLPIMELTETNAKALSFGQKAQVDAAPGTYRAYASSHLLALVVVDGTGCMRSQRGFNLPG